MEPAAMLKGKIGLILRYTVRGLPLAGITAANLLPLSARGHQFLVLVALVWFQVFILFEVFSVGK
jgi:hypothetical protein